jgi:hypothetical protein
MGIKKESFRRGWEAFFFCFGDPSWSQDPKRLEVFEPSDSRLLPRARHQKKLLLRLGGLLSGLLRGRFLSRCFLCHGAGTSFLETQI